MTTDTAGLGAAPSPWPPNPTKAWSPGATNAQNNTPAWSGVLGLSCRRYVFPWSHHPALPRELLGPAQGSEIWVLLTMGIQH